MRVKRVSVVVVAGAVAFGCGFGGSEFSKAMQPDDGKAAFGASAVQTAKPGGEDPVVDVQAKPSYVDAGRSVVPVIRNGLTTNYVVAAIRLEAEGDAVAQRITDRLPTVRNALLQSLYGMASGGRFDTDNVRVAEISKQLAQDISGVSGGGVRAVLFEELVTSST